MRHNQNVDNPFVVPYWPHLLHFFNYRVNVEMVSSVRSVKYLYKYVYIGHDAANITIENTSNEEITNLDEIRTNVETGY